MLSSGIKTNGTLKLMDVAITFKGNKAYETIFEASNKVYWEKTHYQSVSSLNVPRDH